MYVLCYRQEDNPTDPDSYSWCLMNLGIVRIIGRIMKTTVSLTGMEALGREENVSIVHVIVYMYIER